DGRGGRRARGPTGAGDDGRGKGEDQLGRAQPMQLLTYLKLTNRQVGLLINFGVPTLREGAAPDCQRLQPSAPSRLRVNQSVETQAVPMSLDQCREVLKRLSR
ncbi:MAG TPA: GxxExxY protein, partial [Gemmatimonadaceae bacterium]